MRLAAIICGSTVVTKNAQLGMLRITTCSPIEVVSLSASMSASGRREAVGIRE